MTTELIYNKNLNFKNILLFTAPTIFMSIIQSTYSMIDGVFVANIIGENALSALTLIFPYINVITALASMFSSGGSALIMKKMGEGNAIEGRKDFSMLMIVNVVLGIIITALAFLFLDSLATSLNAPKNVTAYAGQYLSSYSFFIIPQLLFSNLQLYTIASGKSKLSMLTVAIGGAANIVLDYVLIKILHLGMSGAAIATGLGILIPCTILGYSFTKKTCMLHFVRPHFHFKTITATISNGFSEFASSLITGAVMLLFNSRMLRIAGPDGIAASTIIFYIFGFMSAFYMGYMLGVSPMLSYFFGADEQEKMHKLIKTSLTFIAIVALISTMLSIFGSKQLIRIFALSDSSSFSIALHGNQIFSLALLLVGFNTFFSVMFTSLSNAKLSALISVGNLCLLTSLIITLPYIFNINGLWLAVPTSELMTLLFAKYLFKKNQLRYGY